MLSGSARQVSGNRSFFVGAHMRAYTVATGTIFALLLVAHLVRLIQEGTQVAADPWFLASTLLAAGFAVWALRLVRGSRAP